MDKIAICISAFFREELLDQAIESILANWQENWIILIGDQIAQGDGYYDDRRLMKYQTLMVSNPGKIAYVPLPFDCGLSMVRNELVKLAGHLGCKYCVISADSLIFNKETRLNEILPLMNHYDLLGFHTSGNKIYWVGDLKLIENECFELNFLDRSKPHEHMVNGIPLYPCTCVENFFIARTTTLIDVQWDESLKMCEHEDFMIRYTKNYKVAWTPYVSCGYISSRMGQHGLYREANMQQGKRRLFAKYNLKSWVRYVNRQNGKFGTDT